jgi:D-arginine dehydrogenase
VLLERVRDQQPDLGDVRIAYRWVGQRIFSSDRVPLIGFDPRERGLFWVAGLGGHGVTGSFAIGRRAAELLTGASAARGDPYAPARFLVAA